MRALVLVIHAMHELWEKALLLYDEEYMEQWDASVKARCCFFNPNSPGRQVWDLIMLPFFQALVAFRLQCSHGGRVGRVGRHVSRSDVD